MSTPCEVDIEGEMKFPDVSLQEKQLYLDAVKIRAERERSHYETESGGKRICSEKIRSAVSCVKIGT